MPFDDKYTTCFIHVFPWTVSFEPVLYLLSFKNHIQAIESWSMIAYAMMDFQSQHIVLDMCAGPGFLAGQICQAMHSDPLQAHGMSAAVFINHSRKLGD